MNELKCFVSPGINRSSVVSFEISILVVTLLFSQCVHVVHQYSRIDTTATWKKLHFFYLIGLTSV